MKLSFGYSPCPNDTYMFAPIATDIVGLEGDVITPVICDVETLNSMAINQILDISKLSIYAYFTVKKYYNLLLNGGAMGFGCGPVLIAKRTFDKKQIRKCRVVFPGELTTAHLLFRLWEPNADQRIFTSYDNIFNVINNDQADCGVIIHESRFTFEKFGFQLLVDLGSWWEKSTGLPIPLGCIAAKKEIGNSRLRNIDDMLKFSLEYSNLNPGKVFPYVRKFAQELSDDILLRHIYTFVNNFGLGFGDLGLKAINKLYSLACELGVLK